MGYCGFNVLLFYLLNSDVLGVYFMLNIIRGVWKIVIKIFVFVGVLIDLGKVESGNGKVMSYWFNKRLYKIVKGG